jgi:hypothetical protein
LAFLTIRKKHRKSGLEGTLSTILSASPTEPEIEARVLIKYPKFSGWCTYMNKKGHVQVKAFTDGKIVHESKRS